MDEQAKKTALRKIPYGLYVVGVTSGSEVNAFTASWLSQCSFQPPLLMMAVKAGTSSHTMIRESKVFAVNLLGKDQKKLAEHFTRPVSRIGNKFGEVAFRTEVTGAPVLEEAIGNLECEVRHFLEGGDHSIVVAEVIAASVREDAELLDLEETGWHYGG
ncbi:MAG: flavin reductase [Armatimonadetes bacterium]|nr:flavin reductase [Armatimonadota bacterium]